MRWFVKIHHVTRFIVPHSETSILAVYREMFEITNGMSTAPTRSEIVKGEEAAEPPICSMTGATG